MSTINGNVSFWYDEIGLPAPRPALPGDLEVDVAIVGAGYTGLWTAYYLKKADPSLDIAILESHFAGFGASGRNGGWLANSITGGRSGYEKSHGRELTGRFQELLNEAIDEVIAVAAAEGIDADILKGGELLVARNPAQLHRLGALARDEARWPEGDAKLLTAEQTRERINVAGTLGGMHIPHCARIQPAKLVQGLAAAVERLGVRIYEQSPVTEILGAGAGSNAPGAPRPRALAVTGRGQVAATHVLRATEGFTANIKGLHREWLPMNSSMIVTAPLEAGFWAEVGWEGRETLEDLAHTYIYAQRTADDRVAIGGRGVPYRFGSRTDTNGETQPETIVALERILKDMFPAAADAGIERAWAGVLGVPRDWKATVGHDPKTGLGFAGGYVGTGVTATNLAGRTLADLVLGANTERVVMPWVNRTVRRWEVEPLRWIAVQGMYAAYHRADAQEAAGRATTSPVALAADFVSGR
ncbi:NAD(P)/FAD-dependent oxidoreductase [Paeniglutamicibacter cryotolerans]|uniref:Glycine/D-amino acid oxidase-like deaminating enzyme n=1 Tax=Paeniglutamicibacter cryotolerans TaxID=670079 RepID=A0A839QMM4_9MICC|nr:FAD-dependent oxidoreductase [Paeniglutamicibacter cryotolerans]MBB2994462.1 glycine/D-amino acid oxidase-like deaminating enzyme [Paeniglutamicibacter cryotolerans]